VLLESLNTAEPRIAFITLVQRGMSSGIEALFKRLLATKGPAAIIALVCWSVGWRIEVLIKGLLAAERPVALAALAALDLLKWALCHLLK
jgi:hypothetical protein